MLINNGSGIRCDLTGEILNGDFVYYSVSGTMVHVSVDKVTPNRTAMLDLDISESAYQAFIERCRPNLGHTVRKGSLKCDLSGVVMSGEYDYWHLTFDKVTVPISKADSKTGNVPLVIMNGVFDLNVAVEEVKKMMEAKDTWRKAPMPS